MSDRRLINATPGTTTVSAPLKRRAANKEIARYAGLGWNCVGQTTFQLQRNFTRRHVFGPGKAKTVLTFRKAA
jgi:hypothetical protein